VAGTVLPNGGELLNFPSLGGVFSILATNKSAREKIDRDTEKLSRSFIRWVISTLFKMDKDVHR